MSSSSSHSRSMQQLHRWFLSAGDHAADRAGLMYDFLQCLRQLDGRQTALNSRKAMLRPHLPAVVAVGLIELDVDVERRDTYRLPCNAGMKAERSNGDDARLRRWQKEARKPRELISRRVDCDESQD